MGPKRKSRKTVKVENEKTEPIETPKKKTKREHLEISAEEDVDKSDKPSGWTPDNWPESYENIKVMMEGVTTPLEAMPWFRAHDPKKTKPNERFRILIALMLSSQTKDEQTLKVWEELCAKGLSADWLEQMNESKISDLIGKVNFRNVKASNIKKVASICKDSYNGGTPDNFKELTDLPGVGPKMAFLFLQSCYNKSEGLGVDVHMNRLANRLGWVKKETKDAEKTRIELESWLPKEIYFEFNRLIPRFGQAKCDAKNPLCSECLNKDICPSSRAKTKKKE